MKVSIIVSVYNGDEFLKSIEEYLQKQSFDDYEAIFVVDSRSNDGSLEGISSLCDRNGRCRYFIQEEPTKLGGAKNIGIREAQGDYLWFLDIDDVPSPDFLKVMMESKEITDSDMSVCNFQFTDDKKWVSPPSEEVLSMSGKAALHARSLNLIPVTSWSMLYNRKMVIENGIRFEEMMAEDIAFSYLTLNACKKVCYVTAPIYGYYQNANSFCKNNGDERGKSELKSYMYLSKKFPVENEYLQNRFCLIGMRSLVHMTPKGFSEMVKDDDLKEYVGDHLTPMGMFEYRVMRVFPRTYHFGVNWYIKHFYCRMGRIYTDKGKMKTLRKIVENDDKNGTNSDSVSQNNC